MGAPPHELTLVQSHQEGFGREFACAPDGTGWASAASATLHLWDGDKVVDTIEIPGYQLGGIKYSPDGATIRIGLWLVDTQARTTERLLAKDPDLLVSALETEAATHPELFGPQSIDWSDDGRRAVIVTEYRPPRGLGNDFDNDGPSGQVLLVDGLAERVVAVLEDDTGFMPDRGVALSDRWVAVAGASVRVHDLDAGRPVADLGGGGSWWAASRFSPDGRLLAAIGVDGAIGLWSTADWSDLASWSAGVPYGSALAFDSSGERLAVAGTNGPLGVWSVGSAPAEIASAPAERGVQGLAFDPAGRLLVATTPPGQAIDVFELPA
ncbi:MAG: hypothetical protein M3N98_11645 [Actinomycetota bacterium]|nr:hypothetical protein [Actinomycetota bacterium]